MAASANVRMKHFCFASAWLAGLLCLAGCATYRRQGLDTAGAAAFEKKSGRAIDTLGAETEDKILALNPDHVTAMAVAELLAHAPAPHIFCIHGGVHPANVHMISFAKFLAGMGYPESSLRNPDGTWTFSCYESADMLAGMVAWYYEKDGLRPMLVGHSQGGMQVIKILDDFAGPPGRQIQLWNPLTWKAEPRTTLRDPLTGTNRPAAGLKLPFAAALDAGGLGRLMPNQWSIDFRLRMIPDSVEEFTGFYNSGDLLGGDLLGYGSLNLFHAKNSATVRNVRLPASDSHMETPGAEHLLKSRQIRDWINNYTPVPTPNEDVKETFDADSRHILFAADVWFSVKKHWVLELQRLIRARRAKTHGH